MPELRTEPDAPEPDAPPCQCARPGMCPRYGRIMPPRLFELCRDDPRYRRIFESPLRSPAPSPADLAASVGAEESRRLPAPPTRRGPKIRRWAVGMTTAPRRRPTLDRALDAAVAAGWDDLRLFAEPGADVPPRHARLPVTRRESLLGPWPNYFLGLHELLLRRPDADAFLMLQDDALLYPGENGRSLREYLEETLWPDERAGAVSLYTSAAYASDRPGWRPLNRRWIWGALAFVFARDALVDFLSRNAVRWRLEGKAGGVRNIDVVVGEWSALRRRPIWLCSPSLAQHIGETSTIWPSARAAGKRRASNFAGDDPGCEPCARGAGANRA